MKTPWVVVGALVALAGAWWLLGRGAGEPSPVSAPPPRLEGEDRAGPELRAASQGPGARGREGTYVLRGTVTLDGRPAAATLHVEALDGYDWVLEGRRPTAGFVGLFTRLEAPAARGPARELVVAAGAFSIDGLARGVYRIRAHDAQGRRAMSPAFVGAAREDRPLELRLVAHGERLEGAVRWSDGVPVSGQVAVEPASATPSAGFLEGDPVGPLTLDAEGRFVAEGLPRGPVVVRVRTTEGVLAVVRAARVPRSEPWVLTLERPGASVRGHVISAVGEVGVSGAGIVCAQPLGASTGADGDGSLQIMTAETALDGAFTLAVVALPAKLSVFAEGYAAREHQVRDASPQRIVLSPLGEIVGRVVSARDGTPAAGAIVRYEARGSQGQVACGPDGRFRLEGVPPPEALVYVWGGGWVQAPIEGALPSGRKVGLAPGGRVEVELEALPSARLEVRVLDAAGAPVPGAQVDLARFGVQGGPGGWIGPRSEVSGRTDAAGATVLAHVPSETDLWLAVHAERSERVESGPHRAGGAPIEIRLGTARWVEVTVLHADDGTPVEGARLTWIARSGTGSSSSGGQRTDARGQARLGPVKQESYFVRVDAGAGLARSEEIPVEVPEGSTGDLALTIRATREARVEGRVLFPDGSPAPRVRLRLGGEGGRFADPRPVTTGARGEFVVGGLAPGEHLLSAEHALSDGAGGGERVYRGTWRVQAGQRDLELRLEDASAEWIHLAFEVLDPEGRPVEQASVHLLDGFVSHGSAQVQQGRGGLRFKAASPQAEALAAGRLVPWAMHARRSDGTRLPFGRVRGAPLAPTQRSVTLRLPPERVIEGRVLDLEGAPVPGARLELEPLTLWSGGNPTEPTAESDAQGRFRFGGLGDEPMRLRVVPPADFFAPAALEVVPGGREPVVRLTRGRSARVRVLDPQGRPLAQCVVTAQPAAGVARTHEEHLAQDALARRLLRQATTDADGVAVLRGLDVSLPMALSVAPPSTRDDLLGGGSSPWSAADTEVRLEAGLEIRGVVRDVEGQPLPHAIVYVADGANGWSGHSVGADGTFRVPRLKPGSVALKAVAHRDQRLDPTSPPLLTVEAGRRDLVIVLAAPVTFVVEVEGGAPPSSEGQPLLAPFAAVQLLAPLTPGGRPAMLPGQPRRDGTRFIFEGQEARLVTVWVRPDADGRYGLLQDVPTDGGPVRVRRQPGRRISGRVLAPPGAADVRVSAIGAELQVRVDGTLRPDGTYEILGLPPGLWHVDAGGRDASGWLSARGEVDAGGTLDLTIEPVR